MRRGPILALVLSALSMAACAGAARPDAGAAQGGPGPELLRARAAMAEAWADPMAPRVPEALSEASRALAEAEQEARLRPGRLAEDAAYVARRKAEQARLEARCAAAREALTHARRLAAQAMRSAQEVRAQTISAPGRSILIQDAARRTR